MKHLPIITIISCLLSLHSFAQKHGWGEKNKQLEQAKIALITNTLNLSTEQAKDFWPLYNDYDDKKAEVRHKIRRLAMESNTLTASDEQLMTGLKDILNLRQKEIDIEREYQAKFLKVLNVRQVAELAKTEQKFIQMLIQKVNRQENRGRE